MELDKWDEVTLSYAAGFLDGEGCFSVDNKDKLHVTCSNTNRPVIEWFKETFGGSISKNAHRKRAPHHRTCYSWVVVARDAHKLCCAIVPFLKEKTEQALLLIAVQQTKTRGGPRSVSPEVSEERTRLKARIKELKHVTWG